MKSPYSIRAAVEADLGDINDIYNHYVLHSTCTYQEQPETMDDRRKWFCRHGEKHPVTVALENDQVVGWGSVSPFHARSAYRYTVENSIYVHHEHLHRGIGLLLLEDLIRRCRQLGHRAIIAGIDGEQTASVAIHLKFHFVKVGHLNRIGFKFGRWLDVVYMELELNPL
ncbi:MAG TPA: GNAT family N-acetyltransferase [Candidatus Acidoferrales bacterium]|nr:GNAT family N-acetyltransferase [Candidatus Acidoferrales bacterium]